MKKTFLAGIICFCTFSSFSPDRDNFSGPGKDFPSLLPLKTEGAEVIQWVDSLYNTINLSESGLSKEAFYAACKGYEYLLDKGTLIKQNILTICDYSQSSCKKRLYVIDIQAGKLLFNTYVSHGKNSGGEYATSFSNTSDSYKSSLGFMITAGTYIGGNGYSMRLNGVEKGFNSNVFNRDIVMHGSDYVGSSRVASGQVTGRSFGCPAVPREMHRKIIDCIKEGSCFFSYYPNPVYVRTSAIINASFTWPVLKTLNKAVPVPDSISNVDTFQTATGISQPESAAM